MKEEHFCTIVSSGLLNKIRLIASREGLQIKEVVNAAFEKAIKSYERKHGVIKDDSRSNIDNLFWKYCSMFIKTRNDALLETRFMT